MSPRIGDRRPSVDEQQVSVSSIIAAPADAVFAVLADPTSHASIDGTGWVSGALDTATLVEVGQVFRMAMYHPDHPDGDYRIANLVEVLDRPRSISWKPGTEDASSGELSFGGWTWRYDLAPVGPDRTAVTLTYDWSGATAAAREVLEFPPFGLDHLDHSLAHLAQLCTS